MFKDRIQSGCPELSGEGIIAVHESREKGRDQFRTDTWPAGKDMVISKPIIHPYGVEGGEHLPERKEKGHLVKFSFTNNRPPDKQVVQDSLRFLICAMLLGGLLVVNKPGIYQFAGHDFLKNIL